jgi:hypothetical protein
MNGHAYIMRDVSRRAGFFRNNVFDPHGFGMKCVYMYRCEVRAAKSNYFGKIFRIRERGGSENCPYIIEGGVEFECIPQQAEGLVVELL